jgi:hypothetical protein
MLRYRNQTRHCEHRVEHIVVSVKRWHLGLLLALALSVTVIACGTQQERRERPSARTSRPLREMPQRSKANPHVSQLLLSNFELLRAPPEGIPPAIRRSLDVPVFGMRWSLARRIPVRLPGAYWLAPGAENLCIVATTPKSPAIGTVCASVTQALRHGVANTSLDPVSGRRVIVGVAPKGTHTVLLQSGRVTRPVRTRRGYFLLRDDLSAPLDQITLRPF